MRITFAYNFQMGWKAERRESSLSFEDRRLKRWWRRRRQTTGMIICRMLVPCDEVWWAQFSSDINVCQCVVLVRRSSSVQLWRTTFWRDKLIDGSKLHLNRVVLVLLLLLFIYGCYVLHLHLNDISMKGTTANAATRQSFLFVAYHKIVQASRPTWI